MTEQEKCKDFAYKEVKKYFPNAKGSMKMLLELVIEKSYNKGLNYKGNNIDEAALTFAANFVKTKINDYPEKSKEIIKFIMQDSFFQALKNKGMNVSLERVELLEKFLFNKKEN